MIDLQYKTMYTNIVAMSGIGRPPRDPLYGLRDKAKS